jgi:enoyl-[acyl-carrier protein] reductase I
MLRGKTGLIVGIANDQSIAWGCAAAMADAGARLAVTYVGPKAEPHVRPLAERVGAELILPCDVREPGQLEAAFQQIADHWGRLDFLVHSIAYAPREDLHGRVVDCSRDGFLLAMDVSCHSFVRMARLAEPLMTRGGCLITISFFGAERVVRHYNLMGPVKAALEATCRYMAAELAIRGIRVHALSPGPMRTRAASGLNRFDDLMARAAAESPTGALATIEEVGALAAYLASDGAKGLIHDVFHVDGGYHLIG